MSNLVHRRRRCARIDLYTRLCLDGSTPEDGSEASPRSQRISLWLQGSPFCTAIGSYFVLWLSVCQQGRPDGWGGSDREARVHDLAYASGCKGVSPGKATNFLIYFLHTSPIRPIRSIRVRIETSRGQEVYLCLSPCASTARGFYCFCLIPPQPSV